MTLHRKILQRLAVTLCLTAPFAFVSAQTVPSPLPQDLQNKTVVLVHGFFADGSGWKPVIERLQAAHIRVIAVQEPLASLASDVEATRRVIDEQPGQVVLVGHSYGGFVITNAGIDPKVVSLVYVAAFAPEVNDSVASLLMSYPKPPWQDDLTADDGGNLSMTEADYVRYFAPDLPVREARALSAVQVAPVNTLFTTPAVAAAWRTLPDWYVLAEDDQMINPDLQVVMSSRMNAHVTRVKSSHSVMLSHPDLVAATIIEAFLHR